MGKRSKGCRISVQRKIKCDEGFPECSQCINSKRKCSGPCKGAHFIDMTSQIRERVESLPDSNTRKPKPLQKHTINFQSSIPARDDTERCSLGQTTTSYSFCESPKLPTTYQPNKAIVFQQLYIAHFISFSEIEAQPWVTHLPVLPKASSCPDSPEVLAIKATTMTLYGRYFENQPMEIEAAKTYAKGLESQRNNLLKATQHSEVSTSRAVCAAMMFSFFESVLYTSPLGWLEHFRAAEQMLVMTGPKKCQNGLMHMLFRAMRIASVIILFLLRRWLYAIRTKLTTSMVLDKPSIFASETWCAVPFELQPKSSFYRLLDILLQLPSCLPIRNRMRRLRDRDPLASEILRQKLELEARQIQSRLDYFWEDEKPHIDSQNPFYVYVQSMYDAGNIIVLSHLSAASLSPGAHHQQMINYGDSILTRVAYHERLTSISFSVIFPIKIVCLLSPSETQKVRAQIVLLRWGTKRGLRELCTEAAPTYRDRSHG